MVYVIDKDGRPIMPCKNNIARLLLENGRAEVKKKEPFTIVLNYETTHYKQNLTLNIETDGKTFKSTVTDRCGRIVYEGDGIINQNKEETREKRRNILRRYMGNNKVRKRSISSYKEEVDYITDILPITDIKIDEIIEKCNE